MHITALLLLLLSRTAGMYALTVGCKAELAAAVAANPALLPALEAAWRCFGSSLQGRTPQAVVASGSLDARMNLANAATSLALAPAATDTLEFLQQVFGNSAAAQQQLYAVHVTCLKSWVSVVNAQQQEKQTSVLVAPAAASAVGAVIDMCSVVLSHLDGGPLAKYAPSSSKASSSSSNLCSHAQRVPAAAAAAAPWVALLACCLFVLAAVVEADAAAATGGAANTSDTAGVLDSNSSTDVTRYAARTAAECMQALSRFLPIAGLPAEVLQQLQQQQETAQQQLTSVQAGAAAATGSDSSNRQQLRSFAQAVAGRIPLSTACNNPGCVSLAQRSELLLVGGKSCVCGRCKAAR
jgi:hypothetical protein